MTPQEIQAAIIKASPILIHSINGSKQAAVKKYMYLVGQEHNTTDPAKVLQIIWAGYESSHDKKSGLALYLNTQMTKYLAK